MSWFVIGNGLVTVNCFFSFKSGGQSGDIENFFEELLSLLVLRFLVFIVLLYCRYGCYIHSAIQFKIRRAGDHLTTCAVTIE